MPPRHIWRAVHPTATTTPPAGAGRTPARSSQDQGRYLGRLPRPTPCPTVYFLQCSTTTLPRFGGKTTTSTTPCACTPSLLVTIKGGGGLPLRGLRSDPFDNTQHSTPLSLRYWHTPQSTPSLAETWELPSLSRLACTSYYRQLRCKMIQCPRTPPCWTYGPAAGTRINPCVTVLPLASTSGTRKHAALLVGIRTAGSGHRKLARQVGALRDVFSFVPI